MDEIKILAGVGIEGDANAGQTTRQLCLISRDASEKRAVDGLCSPKFFPNIEIDHIDVGLRTFGRKLRIGTALIEIERVGKDCYPECAALCLSGPCSLANGSLYARVIESGIVRVGETVEEV
ncbi:MAG: hypothetical protein WCT14_06900 [Treponemataceae bacterium]